ncbi:MAG TPA: SIMPL domain-containing protein [Solirubrobacteraceae bacterium]|nr:SIMPL domain-containing protein [Solirubrobacteraceae bacterium]
MPVRIVAVVTVLSLIFASAAVADTTSPSTLSVDGSGSVMVTPDVASLSVSVARSAARSAVALSAANLRVSAVVAAIRAAGVPKAGIQTNSIDVSRRTVREGPAKHQHRVRRYTATESLSITSTTSIVGRVIDAATRAGADSINGPDFSFSDPSAGVVAATNAALADARRRGNAAAASLGYRVTGVHSVDLNPQSTIVSPVSAAPGATSSPTAPTRIHPGAEEVDATVAIVYTIVSD